jgi:GNAT superfamily N-acetyltransferase
MLRPMPRDEVPYAAGLELALETTGEAWVTVRGRSMLPFIWPGARLRVVRASVEDVALGDVVVVVRGADPVIHRVVRVDGGRVITRGDAHAHDDLTVTGERLVARVAGLSLALGSLPVPLPVARRVGDAIARHGLSLLEVLVPASRRVRTAAYRMRRALYRARGVGAPVFEIRDATEDDLPAITRFRRARGMGGRGDHEGLTIALCEGEIVGSVRLEMRHTTSERLILDLYVSPAMRGHGLGERLMRAVARRAARIPGATGVRADVRRENPSRRCVARAGFVLRDEGPVETWWREVT